MGGIMKLTRKNLRRLIFEAMDLSPEERHRLKYRKEKQLIGNLEAYNDESELVLDLVDYVKDYVKANQYSGTLDLMAPEDKKGIVFDPVQAGVAKIAHMMMFPGSFRRESDDERLIMITDKIRKTYGADAVKRGRLNPRRIIDNVENEVRNQLKFMVTN